MNSARKIPLIDDLTSASGQAPVVTRAAHIIPESTNAGISGDNEGGDKVRLLSSAYVAFVEIYFSGPNHYTSAGIVVRTTKINFNSFSFYKYSSMTSMNTPPRCGPFWSGLARCL